MSSSPDRARVQFTPAQSYAHRGLWGMDVPENSLAAFRAAADARLGVELDVRLPADGLPVVFHDATLDRMCGDPRRLDQIQACELPSIRLPDGTSIPALVDVLRIMASQSVLIELKVDQPGDLRVADAVVPVAASAPGHCTLMSFDEATVSHLRSRAPDRPVGLLIDTLASLGRDEVLRKLSLAERIGCDYVAPHHTCLPVVAGATRLPLITWTIRTPDHLAVARFHGAAPIFEGPGRGI